MERKVFDRMAELDGQHWWYVARREILATLIGREVKLPSQARVLEIGCGTGHNLDMLARFGRLEAVELDAEGRALAAKRLGRPVHDGLLPGIADELGGGFDLIALLDVLEHVEDDGAALAAILTMLKPGGALLLTVPANPWMWTSHDVIHHHFRRYRRRELRKLARESGFEIALLSPFNSLLFPLIAAVRVVHKLTGKGQSDDEMPSPPVNRALHRIFSFEQHLVGRIPLPAGVSLVAILRRPSDPVKIAVRPTPD